MNWKKYGLIISSDYRKKVLASISEGPKTPKQIAKDTNLYISHVSKTLTELSLQGIIVCLTPDMKRGRVYDLTEEGKEIATYLKEKK